MKYTEEQIEYILEKKPELKKKPVPSLDAVIVEFLKRFEVNIDSASFQEINLGTGVKGGLIGIQRKKAQVEEWTKWKQWALDHKDFEDFRVEKIDSAKKYNEEIAQKLKDPAIQKQFEPLMEAFRKEKNNERELFLCGATVFLFLVVGIPLIVNFVGPRNDDSSFNNPIIKTEKSKNYIS